MAVRSKAWVCCRLLAGIAGMDVCVSCDFCVLTGTGLCDVHITRPEGPY